VEAYRGKPSPVRGERLSRLKNLSPLPGLGFAQTETTAFGRGYVLTPLRGSFCLIPTLLDITSSEFGQEWG